MAIAKNPTAKAIALKYDTLGEPVFDSFDGIESILFAHGRDGQITSVKLAHRLPNGAISFIAIKSDSISSLTFVK